MQKTFGPQKSLGLQFANSQITSLQIANPQTATSSKDQQICGFAICGTYLRTAHL
jgi:hypothetical protein